MYNDFILKSINYNYICKGGYKSIKMLPGGLHFIKYDSKNKLVSSQYNILLLLIALKFVTGTKPYIIKSKKDLPAYGIRKFDCIGVAGTLRKQRLFNYFNKIINNYSVILDFTRKFSKITKEENQLVLNIKNLQKIDYYLNKEHKVLKEISVNILIKLKRNHLSNKYSSNSIILFLSHLGFKIN